MCGFSSDAQKEEVLTSSLHQNLFIYFWVHFDPYEVQVFSCYEQLDSPLFSLQLYGEICFIWQPLLSEVLRNRNERIC